MHWAYDVVGGNGVICTISSDIYDALFRDRKGRREYERALKRAELDDVVRNIEAFAPVVLDPIDHFIDFECNFMQHIAHTEPGSSRDRARSEAVHALLEDGRTVRAALRRLSGPGAIVPALQHQLADFAFLVELPDKRPKGEMEQLAAQFVEIGERLTSVVEEADTREYYFPQSQSAMWVGICVTGVEESAGTEEDFTLITDLLNAPGQAPVELVRRMQRAQTSAEKLQIRISSGTYSYVERGSDLAAVMQRGT